MAQHYFYDVTREDPVFQSLLGDDCESSDCIFPPIRIAPDDGGEFIPSIPDLTNPTALSETALSATLPAAATDHKAILRHVCHVLFRSEPKYALLSNHHHQGSSGEQAIFETMVDIPSNEAILATATGPTLEESETMAARLALRKLKKSASNHEWAVLTKNMFLSFRAATVSLPFPLRFQLERCLLTHSGSAKLHIKRRPCDPSACDVQKNQVKVAARRMVLVFIQIVLPPLLEIPLEGKTISELFADEIWDELEKVKRAIGMGSSSFDFWETNVRSAMERAKQSLANAERVCQATESQLDYGANDDFEIIHKRSMWPTAEYRCKIQVKWGPKKTVEALQLVPTDYQVVNKNISINIFEPPNTRRALREVGWLVRDRFILISGVKFDPVYNSKLADWLKTEPRLCNRSYCYLFDKGTGRPNVWLYSPPKPESQIQLSREDFLKSLGCFDGVSKTKLGDRIGLAFTQTKPVDQISMDRIIAVPEIIRNGYKFSDGCGVYGINIAKKVQVTFMLDEIPGAIQIRMGGVKGMLSLKQDFPADCVGIRPSQVKFRSNHKILEVKAVAKANDKRDNKLFSQILLIMSHLKIPNRVILDLQALACAEMAAENGDKDVFNQIIAAKGIAKAYDYVHKVVRHGRKLNDEPFSPKEFAGLKKTMTKAKSRLNLRTNITLMLGVLDEHGYVGEGEVLVGNGGESILLWCVP